jgi:hypothetical protein
MRTIVAGALSIALLAAFTGAAIAGNAQKHRRDDALARKYPYATPRQLQNERAYERGEYYEHDSTALIPGTRAWFDQKEREGGDRRF